MLQKNKHLLNNATLNKEIAAPKSLESWQINKLLQTFVGIHYPYSSLMKSI